MKVCTTCNSQWPDEQKFCPNDGSALRSAGGSADLVGTVIGGNFHIIKKLGEGGMGAVYLGEHVKMSRKCAIKVMTQSMANDPDAIARFNREATNAARINHPNVCAIYDFGEKDGLIFLAMEFIEGGSLTSVIEAEGALQPARAARIIQQAGDALSAAHELGIVHRDLKPDNIMITKGRDGGDMVKVVDFGIAKAMGGEEGQKVTKTGLVVGTPEYMSPEQLSGDKLDGRSDIYSLALVFFRMLTGSLPFQADSAQETMIKRLTDDPMPLNAAMPGASFPARLQAVMDRALARMPAQRYTNAAEFARDAARALEGVVQGPITEGATQLIDAAKTIPMAATRVSTEKPGPAKTAVRTPDTPMPRPAQQRPAKKKSMAMVYAVVGVVVLGGGAAAAVMMSGNDGGNTTSGGAVTESTANKMAAGNPSGGASNPAGGSRPRNDSSGKQGNTQTTTGGTPAGTGVDSAAIDRQLEQLLNDSEEDAKLAMVHQRTADIYSNAANPKTLRAQAAYINSLAWLTSGDMEKSCQWIANALIQRPRWSVADSARARQAC